MNTGWICPTHGAVRPDLETCPKCAPKEVAAPALNPSIGRLLDELQRFAPPPAPVPYVYPYPWHGITPPPVMYPYHEPHALTLTSAQAVRS